MPIARKVAPVIALVPMVAEAAKAPGAKRVRLSRAFAASAKAAEKQVGAKPKKIKLRSDRYTIPADEHADLVALKKRLGALGIETKKSALLRAGIKLLAAMDDAPLEMLIASLTSVGKLARSDENAG